MGCRFGFAAAHFLEQRLLPHHRIEKRMDSGGTGMDYLNHFIVPVIVGLCLVVGYLIKHTTGADNRFIPLIVTVLGAALAVWMNWPHITPEVILGGAVSGLASTGMHQLFKQWIDGERS